MMSTISIAKGKRRRPKWLLTSENTLSRSCAEDVNVSSIIFKNNNVQVISRQQTSTYNPNL